MALELSSLLSRLAHRVPWETWMLTENEFKILEQAPGEEIVTIAYRNGLNIVKITESANWMIAEHVDRNQKKVLRELYDLKICMSVKEKGKKQDSKKPSRIDQEDVERRLLNETIDEVVGIRVEAPETQPQDPYSWINTNIEERLLQSNLIQNGFKAISPPSFASKVQNAIAITLSPPSLNRNQLEAAELELPEATNEIISELGFYTTSIGRELYNKINNVETPIQPVYELEAPNMEIPVEIGVIPNLSAETPAIPPTSPQILDLNLHTEIDKTKTPQISRINTRLTHATPQVATADAQETSSIYYQSALEAEFEKIALEIEAQKKTEPKPLRVNRKKTQRAKTPELIEIEPMNKPLKYHKRKPLVPRDIEVRIPLHFETEYDKKDYQPDDPYEKRIEDEINIQNKNQPAQISAMELEFQPSEIEPEPVENIRDILGFDSEPQQTVSHLQNQTPQLSPARQALNLNSPTPSFLLSPRRTTFSKPQDSNVEVPHPKRPRLEISQSSTHHQSIPHQVPELDFSVPIENQPQEAPFNPRLTSTALRKPLSQQSKPRVIAKHDLEFAKWHQKSKTSLTTSAEFTPSQKVLQSKKTGNSEEFDENGDHLFHSFKGKYDTMIKFVGKNGKIACCSNFSMETFGLYLQIRFLMAERNTWKMSFEEIYPLISLLNVDAKKNLLEMRIHLLNDFKFLMLTLDGDEEQIVDIEIPINQQMEE